MKTKTPLLISAVLAFAAMTLGATPAPPTPAAPPPPPAPKILVVDRNALMEQSKAGQDIMRQVQAYTQQAEKDLKNREAALQAEGQALQQQVAILAPDAKAKKVQDFQARENALQNLAQQKQAQIQGGFVKAQQQISVQLGPILQTLMQQRGANMLLDRSAVLMANNSSFDITPAAINLLNQKLSSIKVDLVAAPAGASAPAAAAAKH